MDELWIKNLQVRNNYKEHIIGIRCRELRDAHETIFKMKRHFDHLKQKLQEKERDYSDMKKVGKLGLQSSTSDSWKNDFPLLNLANGLPAPANVESSLGVDIVPLDLMTFEKEELQMQLECLASEKALLAEESVSLHDEIQAVQRQLDEASKQIAMRDESVEQLNKRLFEAEKQIGDSSQLIESLKNKLDEKESERILDETKIEDLEDMLMVLQTDSNCENRDKVSSSTERLELGSKLTFEALVKEQESMISHLSSEKDKLENQLTGQTALVMELRGTVEELEDTLRRKNEPHLSVEWEKERKQLKEEIEILGGQLALLQCEHNGNSQWSNGGEQSQQMSQFTSLRAETSILQAEKADLEDRLMQSKSELNSFGEDYVAVKGQLKVAEEELVHRNKELQKLKQIFLSEKSHLLRTIQNLQVEIEKEKDSHKKKVDGKFSLLENQNTELVAQLLVLEDKNHDLNGQLKQVCHELEVAKIEIETLKATILERSSCVNELKTTNQRLQFESFRIAETLGRTEEEFRKERSDAAERLSLLHGEIQEGKNEKKRLEAQLSGEKNKVSAHRVELEKLVGKNLMFEMELKDAKQEIDRLQKLTHRLQCELQVPQYSSAGFVEARSSDVINTPNQKRLKICRSSERVPLSTTQILQTPVSAQKIFQSHSPEKEERENATDCLFVPESPIAESDANEVEVFRRQLIAGLDSEKENRSCVKKLWSCKVTKETPQTCPEHNQKAAQALTSWTPGRAQNVPTARRTLCLSRRNGVETNDRAPRADDVT